MGSNVFFPLDLDLMEFSEPEIFNYSTLLLSVKRDALYVGAREAIFELSMKNVTVKNNKVPKYENGFKDKEKNTRPSIHLRTRKNVKCDFLFFLFYHSKVQWTVAENPMVMCTQKGKSKEVSSVIHKLFWCLQ